MATRFYWGQVITAPTLAFSATWSAAGSTPTRLMMRTVKRKAITTALVATSTETTAAILNKQAVQLVSMPLAAQTITGTVKGYALFNESDLAQDCRVQCEIRIIAPDGTVRGTLLAADTGALSSEFTATATNRRIPLLAATNTLTSVSAQAGDYLVVEVGHRTHVASATSYNVTVRWHDNPGSTDLPEDETDTDATKAPWIEFSQTLILNDTFDKFANALATLLSAEQTNAFTPDFASVNISRDILAEFNTQYLAYELANRPALQFADTTDPTFIALPTVGSTATAAFEDLGNKQPSVANSAEQTNSPLPTDFAPLTRSRDILAEFNTQPLNYTLVEPASDPSANVSSISTTRYVNRVYDSVAVKFIRWITNTPDPIGAAYPGPGVFGVTTLDYVIESSLVI